MKISKMQVHNIRSILDCTINMADYSVLIGQNNVGKSNILAALRLFYDKIKFNDAEDFPKIQTTDNESWVEILSLNEHIDHIKIKIQRHRNYWNKKAFDIYRGLIQKEPECFLQMSLLYVKVPQRRLFLIICCQQNGAI